MTGQSVVKNLVPPSTPTGGKAKLAIVGGAPGADEALKGEPFQGAAGQELNRWLKLTGIKREEVLITDVFKLKPVRDEIKRHFIKRREAGSTYGKDWESPYPYNSTHGFVRKEFEIHIEMLKRELIDAGVQVVIGLGAVALWAFTGFDKIGQHRGTVFECPDMGGVKFVPTYHPISVIRGQFENRVFTISDIEKAIRELDCSEVNRIERELWLEPTLEDLAAFEVEYISPLSGTGLPISFDIETGNDQITCIGFAPTPGRAIVVPFWDSNSRDNNYWTHSQEIQAWQWVKDILEDEDLTFLAHNGQYDLFWLVTRMGIRVNTPIEDTMHMHHGWQPELPKGLGVLSSLYTNEASWKHMVSHSKEKRGNKRDE